MNEVHIIAITDHKKYIIGGYKLLRMAFLFTIFPTPKFSHVQ